MSKPKHISEIVKEVFPSAVSIQKKGEINIQGKNMLLRLKNEIKKRGLHNMLKSHNKIRLIS